MVAMKATPGIATPQSASRDVEDSAVKRPQSKSCVTPATHSMSGCGPLPSSAMKRSIRAVTTGSGTEPSSSTASWNARMLNLKLARCPTCSSLPSRLYLDHSHGPVLAPATPAALPSTRAIPDRCVFYVAHPISLHSCVGYLST